MKIWRFRLSSIADRDGKIDPDSRGLKSSFDETHGGGVHAVAETSGLWAVIEDVAEVAFAANAFDFGTAYAEGVVVDLDDVFFSDGRVEAWPAGTRFELSLGVEESSVAADAAEDAGAVLVPTDAGVRHLGVSLAGNVVGVFAELMEPFAIGLHNLGDGFAAQLLAIVAEVDDSDFAWCAVNFSGIGVGLNCG